MEIVTMYFSQEPEKKNLVTLSFFFPDYFISSYLPPQMRLWKATWPRCTRSVAWGQCSEDMKARIKTHEGYDEKSTTNDCLWLLQQIKSIKLQYHESTDAFVSLMDALQQFCACTQTAG